MKKKNWIPGIILAAGLALTPRGGGPPGDTCTDRLRRCRTGK